jgi:hypothetical protein
MREADILNTVRACRQSAVVGFTKMGQPDYRCTAHLSERQRLRADGIVCRLLLREECKQFEPFPESFNH